MSTDDLSGRALAQVALPVRDLERAIRFYRDGLGLPLSFETNGMAFFSLPNIRLMVGSNLDGQAAPSEGSAIYFDAPDLPELGPKLEARGVRFDGPAEVLQRTPAGELQLRFLRDPDGNLIGLMGVVPPARATPPPVTAKPAAASAA